MYSLTYTKQAVKQLKKLPLHTRQRILNTLERCRIRPYPHVRKLVGNPYFRLRVGEYRIILDIRDGELVILVLEIGHRRNIYD